MKVDGKRGFLIQKKKENFFCCTSELSKQVKTQSINTLNTSGSQLKDIMHSSVHTHYRYIYTI